MILFNKILLMLHFLGLAMGLSVAFANIAMATLIAKATPAEKPILLRFPPVMGKVGGIGITLLIVTGVTMLFTRWRGLTGLPWFFHAKLTAVLLLVITVGYIHSQEKRFRKGDETALARIENAGKLATLFALTAVVFAVLTFN